MAARFLAWWLDAMKKIGITLGFTLLFTLGVLIWTTQPGGDYHLQQFATLKTNFNSYNPSVLDRLQGHHE